MSITKIAAGILIIIVLGVAAVAHLPRPVPAGEFGKTYETPWLPFAADGGSYGLPFAWVAVDPFTRPTPFVGHEWFMESPPRGCRMLYLHTPEMRIELFVTLGPVASLEATAAKAAVYLDDHPLVEFEPVFTEQTADGTEVRCKEARMAPGLLAGQDQTYFLGIGTRGDRLLVIRAGARTCDWDRQPVLDVIRTLRLPRD